MINMARAKEESPEKSLIEKIVPVLLILSIGLAFMVGILWDKVSNLEKGNTGTGTTTAAAETLGRRFIGVDSNPVFCKQAEERIHALKSPAQNTIEICHTAPNTGSPKLPTLVECQMAFQSLPRNNGFSIASEKLAIEFVYDFICRQLRAGA